MSGTSTVSWAVRMTIRSSTCALVSGNESAGAAELLATAERCPAASLVTAGAPLATPAGAGSAAGIAGGGADLRLAGDVVGATGFNVVDDSALHATPPSTTTTAPSAAIRARDRPIRINMTFLTPRKCPGPLSKTTEGGRKFHQWSVVSGQWSVISGTTPE